MRATDRVTHRSTSPTRRHSELREAIPLGMFGVILHGHDGALTSKTFRTEREAENFANAQSAHVWSISVVRRGGERRAATSGSRFATRAVSNRPSIYKEIASSAQQLTALAIQRQAIRVYDAIARAVDPSTVVDIAVANGVGVGDAFKIYADTHPGL